MASSLATFAAVKLSPLSSFSVRGLAGSSIRGMKLVIKSASQKLWPRSEWCVVAKYGDKSVYFDLVRHWQHNRPVGFLQRKFFETFVAPFTKRRLLLKFLMLSDGSTLAYFSVTSFGDILPIRKGPRGKI